MRPAVLLGVILHFALAGCLGIGGSSCSAPDEATTWPDPEGYGIVLATQVQEDGVKAWACNTSGSSRWMTVQEGSCAGPWSWALYGDGEGSPYDSGPPGHYGQCEIARLPAGREATFHEDLLARPGDTLLLRFHVLLQPEQLEDAGGGSVVATFDV